MARGPSLRWLVAASLMIAGCGGSSTNPTSTTPGLSAPTNPTATLKPDAGSEKITVKGSIADSYNGEAVKDAILIVQALTSDALPQASGSMGAASGSLPPGAAVGAMPASVAAVPTPMPSVKPTVGGRQGAAAPPRAALAPDDPSRPRKISVDDRGQFEIPVMAPGTYQITAWAPGYQALTIVGTRPSDGLNIPLTPHVPPSGYEMSGKVLTAAKKPAQGASVVAGLPAGLSAGEPVVVGTDGQFVLKDLRRSLVPVAAYVETEGEIKAWDLKKDVSVAYGPDKKVTSPEFTLRAVGTPVILSGIATSSAAELKPRQVSVLLAPAKGPELPLLTRTPDREGYFRFALPPLNPGETYHVVAAASSKRGQVVYQHRHKLNQSDLKLEVALVAPPKDPVLDVSLEPPLVTWDAMEQASAYRVRLETIEGEAKTLWAAIVTGTRVTLPDADLLALLKKGTRYRLTLAAIKVPTTESYQLAGIERAPWEFAASAAPVEFVYGEGMLAPAAEATVSATPSPRPAVRPTTRPVVRPTPKPAAKPAPKPTGRPGRVVHEPTPPRA